MNRTHALIAPPVLAAALVLAACGSGTATATAARYSSVSQVVAALKRGDLACTGGGDTTPVVSGATSETLCNLTSSDTALIDVFPGTVSTATVLHDSVSTGTEQIWSDVGPNWWVQTSHAYASRVRALLGGRIIAGPWHPQAQPSAVASTSPMDAWCGGSGYSDYQAVQSDLTQMSTDLGNGDYGTAENADATQLLSDAEAAEKNAPPVTKSQKVDYILYMGAISFSATDLDSGNVTAAKDAMNGAGSYKDAVNAIVAACG
jgi:hypothetical protein